jgi:hypothetical protein
VIGSRSPRRSFASFDSATALVRALSLCLRGQEYRALGMAAGRAARVPEALGPLVEKVPVRGREWLYAVGGWCEAVPPRALARVSGDSVARWFVDRYPQRRYPAVAIGSSSGAVVHLCAALGIPFLPQTFLVPVRHPGIHPDEPRDALEWGRQPGRTLLEANPDLQLHHMHDPNQDRLMIARMAYFRVKWRRLPVPYRSFLERCLASGATVLVSDCRQTWPTTQVAERHLFQFGAVGGTAAEEMLDGSERVARFLKRYGSHRREWDAPRPDRERPEAEWGLEPALLEDLRPLARERGWRLRRVAFEHTEGLSGPVADLYRSWYERRGLAARGLLVESFILLEPRIAIASGWVPLWLKFPVDSSVEYLARYLATAAPYEDVRVTLFSHGTESVGLAPPRRWEAHGTLLGVDPAAFPRDFGSLFRYHRALRALGVGAQMPAPPTLEELDALMPGQGAETESLG